jgi:hypothetical protein
MIPAVNRKCDDASENKCEEFVSTQQEQVIEEDRNNLSLRRSERNSNKVVNYRELVGLNL